MEVELYYKFREEGCLVQFFMAVEDSFENICTFILYRSPLPSVGVALSELITKEIRGMT